MKLSASGRVERDPKFRREDEQTKAFRMDDNRARLSHGSMKCLGLSLGTRITTQTSSKSSSSSSSNRQKGSQSNQQQTTRNPKLGQPRNNITNHSRETKFVVATLFVLVTFSAFMSAPTKLVECHQQQQQQQLEISRESLGQASKSQVATKSELAAARSRRVGASSLAANEFEDIERRLGRGSKVENEQSSGIGLSTVSSAGQFTEATEASKSQSSGLASKFGSNFGSGSGSGSDSYSDSDSGSAFGSRSSSGSRSRSRFDPDTIKSEPQSNIQFQAQSSLSSSSPSPLQLQFASPLAFQMPLTLAQKSSMVATFGQAATSNDKVASAKTMETNNSNSSNSNNNNSNSNSNNNEAQRANSMGRAASPMEAMESSIANAKIKLSPNDMTMAAGHHHGKQSYGKFYMYTEVPKKHSYKMGFKRGNHKHMIERKESKHKSHVHSYFKWHDKKGKGTHKFEFKHDNHKKNKKY